MSPGSELRARVNPNGRLVIPSAFRKALGIQTGDEVLLRLEGDELRITTMKQRLKRARRLLRQRLGPGVSLVKELISERRRAARDE